MAYAVYDKDEKELSSYPSLYKAIGASSLIPSSSVRKISGDDKDETLFSASAFNEETDVFYGYQNGNSLDYKNSFVSSYFEDASKLSKVSFVHYDSATPSSASFHNSYSFPKANDATYKDAGTLKLWESNHNIDSYASVMVPTYSGITKQTYSISLSKASIVPPFDGTDSTYAFLGFSLSDDNYLASQGIACNTSTGDWYLYKGLARQPLVHIELGDIVMASSYDEAKGAFTPNEDVTLTEETLKETSAEGTLSYVHRLTLLTSGGRTYVDEYRYSMNTMAATIDFVAGLDIVNAGSSVLSSVPDFMNGSKFSNLVVNNAIGTVLPTTRSSNYGQVMKLSKGDYDLLNAHETSKGLRQSVLINDASSSLDYSGASDVYSFSYDFAPSAAYASEIINCNTLIAALPANASDVTSDDTVKIFKAKKAYDSLATDGQRNAVKNSKRLLDDYAALE